MAVRIVERKNTPLLGKRERSDQLVNWSMSKPKGKRYIKEFPFGLKLVFISCGTEPRVHIHWNPQAFKTWLKSFGAAPKRMMLIEFGICVDYFDGQTKIRLLGAGGTEKTLWNSKIPFCSEQEKSSAAVNWLLGMVTLHETGPMFYDVPETQAEIKCASALAIVTDKPKMSPVVKPKRIKSPGKVLQKPALSDQARAHLLQDVLLSGLVKHG